jgi:hypothetical protein
MLCTGLWISHHFVALKASDLGFYNPHAVDEKNFGQTGLEQVTADVGEGWLADDNRE